MDQNPVSVAGTLSRRGLLRGIGAATAAVGGAALLAACGGTAAIATTTSTAAVTGNGLRCPRRRARGALGSGADRGPAPG